ncbi:MAG: Npt1/Npt2 family nucleotide transporter, partial [Cytophagales bacterium]
ICAFEAVLKDWTNEVGWMVAGGDKEKQKHFVTQMAGKQLIAIGISSIVISLLLAAPIRRRGWKTTALLVPSVLFIGGFLFFGTIKGSSYLQSMGWDKSTVYFVVLYVGVGVVVITKSGKYVFFDSTTNGAYGPLSSEAKRTGKSAVDGVGARAGKAGGSTVMLSLQGLTGLNSLGLKWVVAVMMLIGCAIWISAVLKLDVILSGAKEPKKTDKLVDKSV